MGKEDMEVIEAKRAEGEAKVKKEKKEKAKKKLREKGTGFFADFKKFITKGNVVDMAVAVMLGTAFNAIVNGLVKLIINPLIAVLTQGSSLDELKYVLYEEQVDAAGKVVAAEVAILWGQWLQTIIDFFIIAMTIFVIARIARGLLNRAKRKEIAAAKAAEEKKKAEEKAKADAAAAAAAEKEAQLQAFYANVARQTELLEELAKK
jgi:large conductance mechanosensitive channel